MKDASQNSENTVVILVQTRVSGNIGGVARAMANMGFKDLRLVNPAAHHLNRECLDRAMAAEGIVRQARVYQTLKEASADCHLLVGTSGKKRSGRIEWKSPREFAETTLSPSSFADASADRQGRGERRIALVFGPEDRGISTEDLALCDCLIEIPTSEKFPSLNLSHAVMIVLYELFLTRRGVLPYAPTRDPPATVEQKEAFYDQLGQALCALKVLEPKSSDRMLRAFRTLFSRADPDEYEIGLLRGMCRKILERGSSWKK